MICTHHHQFTRFDRSSIAMLTPSPSDTLLERHLLVRGSDALVVWYSGLCLSVYCRDLHPEDPWYDSVVALYNTYTLFHSRVGRTLSSQGWPPRETVRALAAWRPREWTRRRVEALIRVQVRAAFQPLLLQCGQLCRCALTSSMRLPSWHSTL